MKNKIKKIAGVFADVLVVLLFIIAIIIVISLISQKKKGVPNVFGYVFNVVESDSMSGKIEYGDIAVGKLLDGYVPQEGDIITFKYDINNDGIMDNNTHEIVNVVTVENVNYYVTKGCNRIGTDPGMRSMSDIVCLYKFRIPIVGHIVRFLKTFIGFLLCLILPILIFIGYQVYKLINIINENKKEKLLQEVKEQTPDDIKDAIIKEYLEKQKMQNVDDDSTKNETENKS